MYSIEDRNNSLCFDKLQTFPEQDIMPMKPANSETMFLKCIFLLKRNWTKAKGWNQGREVTCTIQMSKMMSTQTTNQYEEI